MIVYTGNSPVPDAMATPLVVNSGDTINMQAAPGNVVLCISAAATVAMLAVNLPAIPIGCFARIFSSVDVLALTLGGGTILNTVTAIATNDCFSFLQLAAGVFVRTHS